eukprot:133825-Amorphochlora_amoeboformis.AAC.2
MAHKRNMFTLLWIHSCKRFIIGLLSTPSSLIDISSCRLIVFASGSFSGDSGWKRDLSQSYKEAAQKDNKHLLACPTSAINMRFSGWGSNIRRIKSRT